MRLTDGPVNGTLIRVRPSLLFGIVCVLWTSALAPCQTAAPATASMPFSHKRHADLKLECAYCHEKALTGERATFPVASKCMLCHAQVAKDAEPIARLAALAKDTRVVPEKPVYRLPDFVNFSHARHKSETISCATCHGDVWAASVITAQLRMKMKACVDCHKANHAAVTCTVCHELLQ